MLVKSDPSGANPLPRIHEYSLCQAKPPRLCTDVATLIGARRMTLDGDRVTYAQYYPAVMRAIELLRPPLHIDAVPARENASPFDSPVVSRATAALNEVRQGCR